MPAVHLGLLTLIYGLRQLQGQCYSEVKAQRLGVIPGLCAVDRTSLTRVHKQIVRGLVMLEGSLPPCHLNPLLHRFVHYAHQTARLGNIFLLSMFPFERFNKRIRSHLRNPRHALASIATSIQMDDASRFLKMSEPRDPACKKRTASCFVSGKSGIHTFVIIYCEKPNF